MAELFKFPFVDIENNKEHIGYALFDSHGLVHIPTEWFRFSILRSDLAKGTLNTYFEGFKMYANFLETADRFGLAGTLDDRILFADRHLVDQWLAYERDVKRATRSTRRPRESAVKTFYQWLASDDGGRRYVDHPYKRKEELTTLSQLRGTQYALNEAQMEAVLVEVHNECERVLWHTAYDVGLRIEELIQFPKGAIDIAKQVYRLARQRGFEARYLPIDVPTKKKGGDEDITMTVFISAPTLERIVEYHNTDEYQYSEKWDMDDPLKPAFLTCNGEKWRYPNAYKQLKSAVRRSGLIVNIHPHTLRHSSCVSILTSTDHGKTHMERFFAAWKNMRHVDPNTTERYAHLPWDSLMNLAHNDTVFDRSKRLKEHTQLLARNHKEHRGHSQFNVHGQSL